MSVIVKGMEMPDTCEECQLMADGWCYGMKNQPGTIYFHARPDWCPLHPLPEKHGRLIDDSQLRETFGMGERCNECKQNKRDCQYNQLFTRMDFCGWLDEMDIIVEAEGE